MSSKSKPLPSALPIEVSSVIFSNNPDFFSLKDRLIWVDCEMTGLEVEKDALLEIAVVVTEVTATCWQEYDFADIDLESKSILMVMTRVTLLSKWLPQSRSLSPPPKMFWTK